MSEYAKKLGQRVELRTQRLGLAADIQAQRDRLRDLLDPLAEAEALDAEEIVVLAGNLVNTVLSLRGVDRKLAILAREIGE
jgi:hypothetical protein